MIDVFFCYSHDDEPLMHSVRKQLVLYDRQKRIAKWYDRNIHPGTDWKGQIDSHLLHARIILLFVSPSFFDSDYCYDTEMKQALLQHVEGTSVVIPVILRPCLWKDAPFSNLQALPKDGRAITEWQNQDAACKDVADGVMAVVRDLEEGRSN